MGTKMTKTAKAKVTISIVDHHCKADPGVVLVSPGGTIEFAKKVPGEVYIQVSGMRCKLSSPDKKIKQLTIPLGAKVGVYPYAVFCYTEKEFCTGSSMPIIIVPGERDTISPT